MNDKTQINGAEQPTAMQLANKRFCEAYARSLAPGGQLQFNPMQILCDLELLKMQVMSLVAMCVMAGMKPEDMDRTLIESLNARSKGMEESPRLAIAPADALRKRN